MFSEGSFFVRVCLCDVVYVCSSIHTHTTQTHPDRDSTQHPDLRLVNGLVSLTLGNQPNANINLFLTLTVECER